MLSKFINNMSVVLIISITGISTIFASSELPFKFPKDQGVIDPSPQKTLIKNSEKKEIDDHKQDLDSLKEVKSTSSSEERGIASVNIKPPVPKAEEVIFVDANFNRISQQDLQNIVLHDSREDLQAKSNLNQDKSEKKDDPQKISIRSEKKDEKEQIKRTQMDRLYSAKGFSSSSTRVITRKDFEKFQN